MRPPTVFIAVALAVVMALRVSFFECLLSPKNLSLYPVALVTAPHLLFRRPFFSHRKSHHVLIFPCPAFRFSPFHPSSGLAATCWKNHCDQMQSIRSVFLYLDRTYVIHNVKVRLCIHTEQRLRITQNTHTHRAERKTLLTNGSFASFNMHNCHSWIEMVWILSPVSVSCVRVRTSCFFSNVLRSRNKFADAIAVCDRVLRYRPSTDVYNSKGRPTANSHTSTHKCT